MIDSSSTHPGRTVEGGDVVPYGPVIAMRSLDQLREVASFLRAHPAVRVTVAIHANDDGSSSDSEWVSVEAISLALRELGITEDRVTATTGTHLPVAATPDSPDLLDEGLLVLEIVPHDDRYRSIE